MTDLSTKILIEIRDEGRKTNLRLDQVVERLDRTVERFDQTVERLDWTIERVDRMERRQSERELRVSTEIVKVAGAINRLTVMLFDPKHVGGFAARLDDHERRLGELERRVPG